jgi:plastocyanin
VRRVTGCVSRDMNHQHETSKQQRRNVFIPLRMGGLFPAGAIILAACGGGGGKAAGADNMAGMDMSPAAAGNATNASSTAVATKSVHVRNFAFSPAAITVKAGSTVVWTNNDAIQHDVTFDGGGIASSVLNHNDTFSHTILTVGTYHYICSIHPFMHGTVIVTT